MSLKIRSVWASPPLDAVGLHNRIKLMASGVAKVDPRLQSWVMDATRTPVDISSQSAIGKPIGPKHHDDPSRRLGYLIGWTTGDGDCGARLRIVHGVGQIGVAIPDSLTLELFGSLVRTDTLGIVAAVVSAFEAHAADITTDAFLDKMHKDGDSIVCPSGGAAAYTSGDPGVIPAGCMRRKFLGGVIILQGDGAEPPNESMDMDLATEMHALLGPWRDALDPPSQATVLR